MYQTLCTEPNKITLIFLLKFHSNLIKFLLYSIFLPIREQSLRSSSMLKIIQLVRSLSQNS